MPAQEAPLIGYVWLIAAILFALTALIQCAAAVIGDEPLLFIPVPLQILAAGVNGFVAYLNLAA